MSDNNHSDDNHFEENIEEEYFPEELTPIAPAVSLFDPQAIYYIRVPIAPQLFMRRGRASSGVGSALFVESLRLTTFPIENYQFRIIHDPSTNTYRLRNIVPNSNLTEVFNPPDGFTTPIVVPPGVDLTIYPVGNSIYHIFAPSRNRHIIRFHDAPTNATNLSFLPPSWQAEVFRDWFITTDPDALPPPPSKPAIEDGFYSIHPRRRPSSAIEAPLRPGNQSEPFIKGYDSTFTQLWQFIYQPHVKAYQIITYHNQNLFAYDSGVPGVPSRQRYRLRFTVRENQDQSIYWYVNPQQDGTFNIVSAKYPDQKVDLTQANTEDFTPVQLFSLTDLNAQNWILKKIG